MHINKKKKRTKLNQVSSNYVQGLQGKGEKKCLSQSKARASSLLTNWSEKHKRGSKCWVFDTCQVCSNSVQRRSTDVEYISEGKTQFRTYTKARGFSKSEHTGIAWDSRYLPELESEMRSVLDKDMLFFGFEVCIYFVSMSSENVPHLYFLHTAIAETCINSK